MDKQAFKQRMQNLKSYRENNPGKGYWDWRNSLPDNLKYTDDTEYNMRGAYESGAQPTLENDGFYHLPTRNPQTGEILKTSLHPTFWKGLAEDAKIGYNTYFVGDKVYTKSKEEGPINVYADGGEVGNPDDDFTKAINIKLGRTSDGRPKEQGLKPVIDLEDAANITPIGDVLSARDVYNAVTEGDWTGAGLAALGILPFIPSGLQKAKKAIKQIPTVNKNTQSLLDAKFSQLEKLDQAKSNYANEQYRIIERVMEDPSYTNRANEVRKQFGDDYSIPYADMFIAYNMDPSLLPNVQLMDDLTKAGTMGRTADGKFIYRRTPDNDYIPNTAEHELSHFTDLLKSGRTDAHAGNNMFYQMSKDLTKRVGDGHDNYFLLPTEQKAHMNQLREWMFKNGYINKRDQKITTEYMSKILKKLQNIEGTKGLRRAAQQFKSNRTFTKWFNSIPLIGVGAIGVNKYFADENKQKE